ncbi:MAG TPA: hypothetical protein VGF79_10465 [Bacteroidia bacterium]
MKSTLFTLVFILYSLSTFTSCSKYEKIEPGPDDSTDTTVIVPMFIGAHTNNANVIIGFTNSDGSFTQTDMVSGPFILSSNMDKHTSALSVANKKFYFLYRNGSTNVLKIGIVETVTGKYQSSIDLGLVQDNMIHLQYNEKDAKLYFSMGENIYQVDLTNGGLINISQTQTEVKLPTDYGSGSLYFSHLIDDDRFCYIDNDKWLRCFDRNLEKWDTITLPALGSYRSLVLDSDDENIMYAFVHISPSEYKLVKINLNNRTVSTVVMVDNQYELLWFQNRFCPESKLYIGLPFDHQTLPYFITYNVDNGETKKYTTPSHLGQCILK